jgi:hypothetical protein
VNLTQIVSKGPVQIKSILRNPVAMIALGIVGWCALSTVVPIAGVAYAQNTNATIRGQILDPTGALVPSAKVVIINKNTGVIVFSGVSDSAGAFVAPQVLPGTYKITVDAPGLKGSSHRQSRRDSCTGGIGKRQYGNWRNDRRSHG